MSANDLILDLKAGAFRKQLLNEELKKKEIEKALVDFKNSKIKLYDNIQAKLLKSGYSSALYGVPIGLINIRIFKSILIFPITYFFAFGIALSIQK